MSFQKFTSEYRSDREYLRAAAEKVTDAARRFREVLSKADVLDVPDTFFSCLDELQFNLSQLVEEIIHLEVERGTPRFIGEEELPLALRQNQPQIVINTGNPGQAVERKEPSEKRKHMFTIQAGLSIIEYFDKIRDFYNRARVFLQIFSREDYPEAYIRWKDYFISKLKQHGSSLASLAVMYTKAAILRDEEVVREAYYKIVAARNSAPFGGMSFGGRPS
ncbi:MAG: hypothetical protein DRJ38_04000 [Thermoprotei archaeon]|nr:MAG: hypothetical protein DRJ38_04000 [Thermoprotei archaeon]